MLYLFNFIIYILFFVYIYEDEVIWYGILVLVRWFFIIERCLFVILLFLGVMYSNVYGFVIFIKFLFLRVVVVLIVVKVIVDIIDIIKNIVVLFFIW